MVEPVAVACHDVRMSELKEGEFAAVIGGGPIGILVALVAQARGARVVMAEVNPFRLQLARDLGIDAVNPLETDLPALVNQRTGGAGADVVFEVSGSQAGADTMTKLPRTRGRIVVVAIYGEAPKVDLFRFFWRELKLSGARVYEPEDFELAIELAATRQAAARQTDYRRATAEPPGRSHAPHGRRRRLHEDSGELYGLIPLTILDKFNLSGKTALVTGARRGIGKAMAVALAEAGADIVATSAAMEAEGSAVAREVAARGRRCWTYACDLADRPAVYGFIERVKAECPPVDILINNGGSILRKPAAEHPDEYWDKIIEIDLSAQFVLAREFGRGMLERGAGKIVFTASLLELPGRHHGAGLRGGEGRSGAIDQGAGQRMGRTQRPGECHRAGVHRHRQHHRAARRRRCAIRRFWRAFPRDDGAKRKISRARWCSSHRRHRTT